MGNINRVDSAKSAISQIVTSDDDFQLIRSDNNIVFIVDDSTIAKTVENDKAERLHREAQAINAFTSIEAAPIVKPSHIGLGPYVTSDYTIILVERFHPMESEPSSHQLTSSLSKFHTAIRDVKVDFPLFTTQIQHTADTWANNPLAPPFQAIAEEAFTKFVEPVLNFQGPIQPLHGDAWSGQAILTSEGTRWIDLENVCLGPKEWDLAGFSDPSGYGEFDKKLLQKLSVVRSWSVAIWSYINTKNTPELISHVRHHAGVMDSALKSLSLS